MIFVLFGLLIGLEIKHFIADYLLQPAWILAGKGNLGHPGGYAHAAIHALGSLIVLLFVGTPVGIALALAAVEIVIHYALDYSKVHYSVGVHADSKPARYWALHGVDQLAHQLTYVAMVYFALMAVELI